MADLRKKRQVGLDLGEVKEQVSYEYLLEKYAGCSSFNSMDRQVAAWKSLPVYQITRLRKDVYDMPTDIKMVNPTGGQKVSFEDLWNSGKLSEREKDYLILRFNEGKTYGEIGEIYDVSKDAVHKKFKKIFRIISIYCSRGEIFRRIFIPDKIDV
ncbi:MAG: sigma factor-like helix-turn-helix DNA-binding protein [Candidatus Woesearchaeota archaeon]